MSWENVTAIRLSKRESITAFEDVNSTEFLRELQLGSIVAYERLVERLLAPLQNFLCFTMGVPEADAEELTLDVLLTVHANVGTFRQGRAKLTTWIFQIAKNRAIDHHRKAEPLSVELAEGLPDSQNHNLEYAGRNQELMEWLQRELQELSPDERDLLLWRAQEIPYADIAKWHGIAEGTARVRHSRAMERLSMKARDLEAGREQHSRG